MADIKIITGSPVSSGTAAPAAKPAAAASPGAPIPPATATPAAPAASAAPPAAPATAFKDIFSKVEAKAAGPKMLENIGSKTVADKLKPILGGSPQLKKTLEQEKERRQKKMLRNSQIAFAAAFVLALVSVLYFYSELSPSFNLFGSNAITRINEINANLRSLKTTSSKYRYLAAQLDLNSFSYAAEQYLDKTGKLSDPALTATYKATLTADVSELQNSLPAILESLRRNLGQEISLELYQPETGITDPETNRAMFENDLRASLQQYRDELAAGATASQQDLKLADNAIKLVGNTALAATLRSTSVDAFKKDLNDYTGSLDPLLRGKLQTLFTSILSSTSSDIATIGAIKASRMNWSTVIKQIETVTAEADSNFGKGLYNQLGGIIFNSYTFDQKTGKIAISGDTRTADATNFTLISDLIEKFEDSPYFKGAEMRSFSKSGTTEEGYTANFSLNLELESGGADPGGRTVSLGRDSLKARTGLRRVKR